MRMRSPRMAPPVNGLLGSTAMIPTVLFFLRNSAARRSTSVLLPEPGLPVTPIICDLPVRGNNCRRISRLSADRFSTRVMTRERARVSPFNRSCRSRSTLLSQYFSCDDEPLNLAGAFTNRAEFNVPLVFFGRIFLNVAVAAVNLHALIRNTNRNFSGIKFSHRGLFGCLHALILHPCGAIGQKPRGIDFGCHVGKLELDGLEICNPSSELLSLFCISQSRLVSALRHSNGKRGNTDASAVEHFEGVDEAISRFAEQILFGDTAVFENYRGRIAGA